MDFLNIDLLNHYLKLLYDKLMGWGDALVSHLPNLIVATLVFLAAMLASKLAYSWSRKLFLRLTSNDGLAGLGATIMRLSLLGLGIFLFLSILNLEKTVTSLLAGAGILGLALSFAFQDTASNLISGILIVTRKPFAVGDHIESHDLQGTVQRINLRTTKIATFNGQHVLIPNKDVYKNPIINYSSSGERRVDIEVGISYNDDLKEAAQIATKAVAALEGRDRTREPSVIFTGFGSSSINFDLRFWIAGAQADFLEARSAAIIAIKQAFDKHGISIPFPIRTLEFRHADETEPLPLRMVSKDTS